jgi:hypothetical protein
MAANSTPAAAPQTTEVSTITAYGFAKVVNGILREKGLKELPPQMFYSYKAKGLIGNPEKGKAPMTEAGALAWTERYLARKAEATAKATKASEAAATDADAEPADAEA